jgi:preprotein translocase subunit SecD
MKAKNLKFFIFITTVIAVFCASFIFPSYLNKTTSFINSKTSLNIPQISEESFKLGLDLQGGAHLIYKADLSKIDSEDQADVMQGLRDVIERRVNAFGVQEPLVQTEENNGEYRLIVDLAGVHDVSQAVDMIGKTPLLEFKTERTEEETQIRLDKREEVKDMTIEQLGEVENIELALEDPYFKNTSLTGQYLKKSEVGVDQYTNTSIILLTFNEEGAELFEQITADNIGKRIAIYIDGMPLSAPVVQEAIPGGEARITGSFTRDEARDLAKNLNAGALPVPVSLISEQTVGPTLGMASLNQSLKAGIFGFVIVLIFMIVFYRLLGLISSISLILYIIFTLFLFKIFGVTLTLSGIGGFILSIGMAVDANILIFSRIREELNSGKTFSQALSEGFDRAWPSIKDGNLTTLIVAGILFFFGTSFVKGFALTLSVGIIVSVITAVFITRNILRLFENGKLSKIKWLWK